MNERYGWIGAALCRAFVLVCAAMLVLTATAALLTRAGMPFAGAYTGGVLAAAVGTLIVSRNGATRILLPSPAITAWLVYEEIIARGIAWQDALIVSAVTALIGVLLMRTVFMGRMIDGLPPVIRTGLLLSLALGILTQAAQAARILLPSPWALTMGGMLSDPLTYFTLVGILLVLLLYVQQKTTALPVGIGIILLLTWGEGFWEIPAAPFLQPAFVLPMETMVGTLDIPAAIGLGITLLIALTVESTAVLAVFVLTSYDLQTGLTLALLTWVLLTAAGGAHHHIHRSTAVLTAVLVLSQLFPQLR